jgi:hypothetical protein
VLEACEAALKPLAERHAVELTREVGRSASVAHHR